MLAYINYLVSCGSTVNGWERKRAIVTVIWCPLSLSVSLSVRLLGFMTIESTTNLLFSTWSQLGAHVHVVRKTASNSGFTSNKFMFVAYFYLPCVLNGHAQQNGRKMTARPSREEWRHLLLSLTTCFIAHPAAIKCRLVATLAMNVGPLLQWTIATQTPWPTQTHTHTHKYRHNYDCPAAKEVVQLSPFIWV